MKSTVDTLTELLSLRASDSTCNASYYFLDAFGEIASQLNLRQLERGAKAVASQLQKRGVVGEAIAIACPVSPELIVGFFGAQYAGVLPIIADAPTANTIERLTTVIADASVQWVILSRASSQASLNSENSIGGAQVIYLEDLLLGDASSYNPGDIGTDSLIQYALAGEQKPSGVVLTHTAVIANLRAIEEHFQLDRSARFMSWLPLHHVSGLFLSVLQPLFSGCDSYLWSHEYFPRSPWRWLEIIARYQISFSGCPGFGYALAMANEQQPVANLNLSSWKYALAVGEPIALNTQKRFIDGLQSAGFQPRFFDDCHMPEQCPAAFTALPALSTDTHNTVAYIVDPNTLEPSPAGVVGELLLGGDTLASRYWQDEEKTATLNTYIADGRGPLWRSGNACRIDFGRLTILPGGLNEHLSSAHQTFATTQASSIPSSDIAIIGQAGLFPQSDNCEAFWTNLERGQDLISEIPASRWNWRDIYGTPDNQSQKTNIKWGGFINDMDSFDAEFFNISPKEAQLMDPMQRKLIEVVWQAIEDAGYPLTQLAGKKVGVFIGVGTFDYLQLMMENEQFTHAYASTGIVHCMTANRISYLFDFKGPSEAVDTACSSSLVALHRAATAIKANECEMAIVGGANALISSSVYVALSNASMLSEDGRCKTFDQSANGYVRGEGIGAVVLKSLPKAVADKDPIKAVVKGSAVNHGGHTASLTAPNPFSQAEVIQDALDAGNVDAQTISYIEAHGTATSLGDPIEINGLKKVFGGKDRQHDKPCAIGSIKTNIGHLEAAAGIAGIIKVLMALKHKRIPAHIHLSKLNENISLDGSPLRIVGDTCDWEAFEIDGEKIPRRAGISSFGFGGVNAHVVLEEFNTTEFSTTVPKRVASTDGEQCYLFVLSAVNLPALQRYIHSYCEFLSEYSAQVDIEDMTFTAQTAREAMAVRMALVVSSTDELYQRLLDMEQDLALAQRVYSDQLLIATVDDDLSSLVLDKKDPALREFANEHLTKGLWREMAELWVLGYPMPWQQAYVKGTQAKRISLPSYPFAGERYWIESDKKAAALDDLEKDIWAIEWLEAPLPADTLAKAGNNLLVLLGDGQGMAHQLVELCSQQGINAVCVAIDKSDSSTAYALNNLNGVDVYSQLLRAIKDEHQGQFIKLVSLWPLDMKASDSSALVENSAAICQHALYLMQAANQVFDDDSAKLWFVCQQLQPLDNPAIDLSSAALWGFAKTALLEHPHLFQAIVDIDSVSTSAELLFNDLTQPDDEAEIIYRGQQRFSPRLKPAQLGPLTADVITKDGAYLVTGGLGALGLMIAKWLAEQGAQKLLLMSRRPLNPEDEYDQQKLNTINAIEALGSEVTIVNADVCELASLKSACEPYLASRELKGIFHLAGNYRNNTIEGMPYSDFDSVASAKVEGTWNLYQMIQDYPLEQFVLFSSAAAVWGAATGSHYSAANYFLDAFAEYCHLQGIKATCIDWGMWADSGIIPDEHADKFSSIGIKNTTPEHGLALLDAIARSALRCSVTAEVDWNTFIPVMNFNRPHQLLECINPDTQAADSSEASISLKDSVEGLAAGERKQAIADAVALLIKEILGFDAAKELPHDKGFFDLGLDSLTSIDLKNKMNNRLGVSVSTTTLFENNTVELLTHTIEEALFEADAEVQVAAESVSDDQLDSCDKDELLEMLKMEMDSI